MSVLVTGGAGFLGSHLVDALLARGEHVIVMDDLSTGSIANLEAAISSGAATFVYADVATDSATLEALIERAAPRTPLSAIYHLASAASPDAYGARPWETLRVNGLGTMSLIDVALAHGARFIYASTSEIYGDPLVHPQPESYWGNVDPIGPRSCYDEGKRFGEAAIAAAVRVRDLDGRIVRFFNCYGPRMERGDGRLIPALLDAIAEERPLPIQGTGLQSRSLTYVDDAIALLLHVGTLPRSAELRPVNIGADDERSVLDIARALAAVAGVECRLEHSAGREGDPQRRRPDMTRARALGWAPRVSIEDGLRRTFRWFTDARPAYV